MITSGETQWVIEEMSCVLKQSSETYEFLLVFESEM